MTVSAHAVRAVPSGMNSPPAFASNDVGRSVNENSPPGTNVGKPVTAADAPGDILTYMLMLDPADDGANYRIDPATGQITVGPRTILDREADGEDTVKVMATDPSGGAPIVATVTITVKNVNEAPMVNAGPTKITHLEGPTVIDLDTSPDDTKAPTYTATDQESTATDPDNKCTSDSLGSICAWSLSGVDMGDFSISNEVDTLGQLSFKKPPNFESPADADMDNMYMVTVVATDSGTPKMTDTRDVVITVTNANDDGTITLSSVQPKVGIDFTATLSDPDGGVKNVKWQWAAGTTCADDSTFEDIAKAKSDTYTPNVVDIDKCLRATASYTDNHGSDTAMKVSAHSVVVDLENRAPVFRAGGVVDGKVIASDTRSIPENSASDTDVGAAIIARDPNADTLTYTLDGSDKSSFAIDSTTGQITVGTGTKLNYEGKKVYRVTVTATDPSQASATIAITINVIDMDEAPVIAGDDIVKEFKEKSTSTVQTFQATDPERRPVYWSLSAETGDDNADVGAFSISSTGALSFASPPDFEIPTGADTGNVYKVMVRAYDDALGATGSENEYGGLFSEKKVTVAVTNVVEQGSISVDRRYPQVNVAVTATLTDGDRVTGDPEPTWQWYKGNIELQDDNGAKTPSYTPQISDNIGNIKVKATYRAKGADRIEELSITVRAAPTGADNDPAFPNNNAGQARSVDENRSAGTSVGAAITATDTDSVDRGKLTYSVVPDTDFSIDWRTGQLKTKALLDHETPGILDLTVTATDPSGDFGEVIVTVTVNDKNEVPTIDTGPTRAPNWSEGEVDITGQMVATYTASDVDVGDTLVWSLTGTDASDFEISDGGVLTFREIPDYEKPAAANNLYRVTVQVSDGKLSATRPMTVTVTDEPEDGEVTLSSVQPKVAIELTASLEDSDGGVKDITWQWAAVTAQDCSNATFAAAADNIEGATSATYTPEDHDIDKCLRATASYTDTQGEQTAPKVSDNPVIANTDNRAPMFPDTETGMRSVPEGTDAGFDPAVTADDPDNLTYTLSGTDAASFDIDRATGQLQTKAKLDYEAKNTYMVTVTATDPNGLRDSVDVTIKVGDVDEPPKIIVGGLVVTGTSDVNYAENGMGMVATYSAAGPDAADATWSLSGADAGDLRISSAGVLTFMAPPNYESPADDNTDNIYMVMVNANDGTNDAMKAVSVRVTNVEETGEVTLWAGTDALTMAPQVGDTITGAVMDPDGGETVESWQWSRTMDTIDMNSWMDIAGETNAEYTVTEGDTGYHLRVMATYTDAAGTDMAMEYSMPTMMVTAMMTVPMFDSETATREVAENTEAGMDIGDPVMGTDADGDTLTYTLGGTDAASFDIGSATGQLMTLAALDYETKGSYEIMVTATDPDSASDMITVTITVTNVDEPGMVSLSAMQPVVGTELTATLNDPDGMVSGEMWQWARSATMDGAFDPIAEATDASYTPVEADVDMYLRVTVTYTDGEGGGKTAMETLERSATPANTAPMFATETAERMVPENTAAGGNVGGPVTAVDADNDTLIYRLDGTDMVSFAIDPATGQIMVGTGTMLDYEAIQNTYMVTVTASDPSGATGSVDVMVMVTNEDEPGMVSLSDMQLVVGAELTATLMNDPDGMVSGEMWQWARSATMDGAFDTIAGATSSSYTPVEADGGMYLRVTVTYTDGEGSGKMAMETSETPVNTAPMFATETDERMVPENTAAGENVGAPATATDADNDTLTYSLDGTDMASFDIDPATGQIMVGDGTMLDYETKASYMVTVTASDGIGSDSIDVMVMVTNVDEPGMVSLSAMQPVVGAELTATLNDPDGMLSGEMWQWARSATMDGTFDTIAGATSRSYTPVEADGGMYLRVTAMYTDGEGSGKEEMASTSESVPAKPDFDPLAEYDADKSGALDKDEVIQAINDYLFGVGADAISKDDVIETINLYLFG